MPPTTTRTAIARALFDAFAADDRSVPEERLAPDLVFFAPPDPGIDRDGYFERCWPGAGRLQGFDLVRTIEHGDEVVVTYEATRADGSRFRNTEVLTFRGEQVTRIEVYFGWDLD
jgi:ketosteroid isomerase-like protein